MHSMLCQGSAQVLGSVLTRPGWDTVSFGLLMCPLWPGLKAKCGLGFLSHT